MSEPQRTSNLLDELKRRRVWRVAVGYAAGAFVILQAGEIILPALHFPDWVLTAVVVACLVGFPVAIVLAWMFQITPEGIRLTPRGEEEGEGRVIAGLTRRRMAVVGGAIVLLMVAAGAVAWLAPRPAEGSVTAGADVIAVLPFSSSGAGVEDLGEAMVDLLSRNLDEVGGVRTVDPRTVMHRWNERAAAGPITDEINLQIGRAVDAGSVLSGSMVALGGEVEIRAELRSVDGRELANATVRGRADDLFGLVDGLSVQLLDRVWRATSPAPAVSLSGVTTSNVEAMRAFLRGEKYYRATNWPAALNEYQAAVAADTSFALGYYRLTRTLGWVGDSSFEQRQNYVALAEQFSGQLPTRARTYVEAERLWLEGRREESLELLREATGEYPDDPEGWQRLADGDYHVTDESSGPAARSVDEQVRHFERALELDPTFLPALIHPLEIAFRFADSARAARYTELAEGAEGAELDAIELLRAATDALGEPDDLNVLHAATVAIAAARGARTPGFRRQVLWAVRPALKHQAVGLDPIDLEMLLVTLQGKLAEQGEAGIEALRILLDLQLATGRLEEALLSAQMPAAEGLGPPVSSMLAAPVLAGLAPADYAEVPFSELSSLSRATIELSEALYDGDAEAARAAVTRAEARGEEGVVWTVFTEVGRALASAEAGSPAALDSVVETIRDAQVRGIAIEGLWFHWLRLSARDPERRERAISLLERPWPGALPFDVARLRVLAEALAAAGRTEEAEAAQRRYATATSAADPEISAGG